MLLPLAHSRYTLLMPDTADMLPLITPRFHMP